MSITINPVLFHTEAMNLNQPSGDFALKIQLDWTTF